MKIKRHKKFQKNVNFFIKHFSWKPPFNLLIDGTFAKAALDNKVNLRDQLPKYFDAAVKLWTTPCALVETEKLGPELYGAVQVLKSFALYKCAHAAEPVSADKCVKALVAKEREEQLKFIPASQDGALRRDLRQIPGLPLVHLNGPAPVFEKPSWTSQECATQQNVKKMEMLSYQSEMLKKMKDEVLDNKTEERKGTKKRKRAGPNPLSCKKPKKGKVQEGVQSGSTAIKKKKRVRVKLPKHVKEEIIKMKQNKPSSSGVK